MIGLDQTVLVYAQATDGSYSLLRRTMPGRLTHIASDGAGLERSDLAASRRLLWEDDYALPDPCQVEVDGERWAVTRGTQASLRGLTGAVVYRRAECVRAE